MFRLRTGHPPSLRPEPVLVPRVPEAPELERALRKESLVSILQEEARGLVFLRRLENLKEGRRSSRQIILHKGRQYARQTAYSGPLALRIPAAHKACGKDCQRLWVPEFHQAASSFAVTWSVNDSLTSPAAQTRQEPPEGVAFWVAVEAMRVGAVAAAWAGVFGAPGRAPAATVVFIGVILTSF